MQRSFDAAESTVAVIAYEDMPTYTVSLSFITTVEAASEEAAIKLAEKAASECGFNIDIREEPDFTMQKLEAMRQKVLQQAALLEEAAANYKPKPKS
jgi:hypothetical protein